MSLRIDCAVSGLGCWLMAAFVAGCASPKSDEDGGAAGEPGTGTGGSEPGAAELGAAGAGGSGLSAAQAGTAGTRESGPRVGQGGAAATGDSGPSVGQGGAAGTGATGPGAGQAGKGGAGPDAAECSEGGAPGTAGPPTVSGPVPQLDWAVTLGDESDDAVAGWLVGMVDGGSLVKTGRCGEPNSGEVLVRVGPDGAFEWEACVPEGAHGIMPNGNIVSVGGCPTIPVPGFEPPASADPPRQCMCELDQQSGAVLAAKVMDPFTEGYDSPSLLVDDTGLFTKRRSVGDQYYILRYDFDGRLLWSVEHVEEVHFGGEALHPDGGVVMVGLGGVGADGLLVSHVDADGEAVSQAEYSGDCLPGLVHAVAVSPAGRVAVVGEIEADNGCGDYRLAWVEPDGAISAHLLAVGSPWGVSFVSEDEVVVWSQGYPSEPHAWALTAYGADGEVVWDWRLDAPDGFHRGYRAEFDRVGKFLFVGDVYRGVLDLGSEELTSNGCTKAFLLRFSL